MTAGEKERTVLTLEQIEAAGTAYDLALNFDGCPCFHAQCGDILIDGHCWRICRSCEYCGVHVTGEAPKALKRRVGKAMKRALDRMDWYGKWTLKYEPRK